MEKLAQASSMIKHHSYIIVKGISTAEEAFVYQVNRRGFLVEYFESPIAPLKTSNAVLSLSAKLKVKLAVTSENRLGSNNDKAIASAIEILTRCKGILFQEAWLTHHTTKLNTVMNASGSVVLLNDYYGSEIAFYMEWLKFYTGYLTIPALTGTSLFALQFYHSLVDCKWNPLFNILMCVWGSLFIESWKRRSSELSNVWDVEDVEGIMDATDIHRRKSEKAVPIDRTLRFALTVPVMMIMMTAVVRIMVFFLDAIGNADLYYGADSWSKYGPTLAYSIVPIATAMIYEKMAVLMNEFEAYPTRLEAENNLILKRFLFQFVNRYCALFYTAFYLQDIDRLRSLLLSMLVMNALINNVTEIVIPFVPVIVAAAKERLMGTKLTTAAGTGKSRNGGVKGKSKSSSPPNPNKGILKNTASAIAKGSKSTTLAGPGLGMGSGKQASSVNFGGAVTVPDAKIGQLPPIEIRSPTASALKAASPTVAAAVAHAADGWNSFLDDEDTAAHTCTLGEDTSPRTGGRESTGEVEDFSSMLHAELDMAPYSLGDDYMEMLVQYGYVTMFVVVFPLGPLLALLNNIVEQRVDMYKLSVSRRAPYSDRAGIGAWLGCLEFINVVSVLTNCFYLCMVSDHLGMLVPAAYEEKVTGSVTGRFVAMVVMEHCMFLMKFILAYLIPDVPIWVLERQAEVKMLEVEQKNKMHLRNLMEMDVYSRNAGIASCTDKTSSGGSGEYSAAAQSRQYVINKLSSGKGAGYFYNPQNLAWLFCVPAILTQLEVNPMYYIPVAGLLFSYLQNEKNKSNIHQALGIVSDVEVLRHIRGELPAWISDSDSEQAEWLNSILQKLWPFISSGVEKMVREKVQPILDSSSTRVVPSMKFTTISLGSVAPRIISVRTYPSNDVACVRMDVELKWNSDMEVVLKVGKTPPLDVELGDIQFSATLRIELKPLINKLPGFGAINITCMKAPYFDFSVKVGSVDVLNVGPADLSIGSYVRNMIRNIVCNMMLYPKSVCIPLMDDKAMVDELQTPATPKGLLHINLISAKKLKAADFLTSDPYVEIRYMSELLRTEVKSKTLNPVWNASFDLMIFDKEAQQIELVCYDQDVVSDEFLGRVVFHLDTLINNKQSDVLDLDLMEVDTGSLQITALYTPLGVESASDGSGEEVADILFNMSQENLKSDIVAEETVKSNSGSSSSSNGGTPSIASVVMAKQAGSYLSSQLPSHSPNTSTVTNGVLTVSQISCQKLRNNNATFGGGIRPYVVFSLGGSSKQTKVQHLADPKYDENFHFMVKDGTNATLSIKVMDQYKFVKDVCVGELCVRVVNVLSNSRGVFKEYTLESRHGECSITMKLFWMTSK